MSHIDIGANTVERIRFYRYSSLALMTTVLTPLAFGILISLTVLVVAIAQGRCWLFEDRPSTVPVGPHRPSEAAIPDVIR